MVLWFDMLFIGYGSFSEVKDREFYRQKKKLFSILWFHRKAFKVAGQMKDNVCYCLAVG